jgi:hypothetical protein
MILNTDQVLNDELELLEDQQLVELQNQLEKER